MIVAIKSHKVYLLILCDTEEHIGALVTLTLPSLQHRICPHCLSYWPNLWIPAGGAVCQDICGLWVCGFG